MVCATGENDVRSWQNGLRAISDVTGRPWENDVRVGVRAGGWGVCSAAHIIFTRMRTTMGRSSPPCMAQVVLLGGVCFFGERLARTTAWVHERCLHHPPPAL